MIRRFDRKFAFVTVIMCLLCLAEVGNTQVAPREAPSLHSSANSAVTEGRIRSDLREILHSPEFIPASTRPSELTRALDDMRMRLEHAWTQLTKWFRRILAGRTGSIGSVGAALAYAVVALLLVLGWSALVRIIPGSKWSYRRKALRAPPVTAQSVDEPEIVEAGAWINTAAIHAAEGDFRSALRAVFLAMLLALDRSGRVAFERSRANGDYLSLLRARDMVDVLAVVAPVTRDFDRCWYGNRPTTDTDYCRTLEAYERLVAIELAAADVGPPSGNSGNLALMRRG